MSGQARASVVVRTFDSAGTVEATFRSLRDQDVPVEVVVVDSGSTDGTLELAGSWADRVVHVPRDDFSFGGALNQGASAAAARVHVALSSHSTLPRVDWVRTAAQHVEDGASAACGATVDPWGRVLEGPFRAGAGELAANRWWGFTNHASAWAAEVWREHPFDERLTATEDKEWSWRVVTGDRYLVVDPALVVPGAHRRDRGIRSYYRRLVKEQTSVAHLRPVPPYGLLDAARDLRRPVGEVPYLSGAGPWGRTRAVEVAARWRAATVSGRAED
ncbi:glycosyltransferase [Pseudokineococcus marinus]|uniref:4,4'-diaponeurosporenoate glycosyltransferase n=1 Tax=Pseudokineococcus marinus TaxID=351215 RepID=A0A849BM66_9ACTN|nr:glycosyltransferase [Pseudokineococcus marinus]NNH21892.1 glycosyltransferase [Pseudokineococcus marinus]